MFVKAFIVACHDDYFYIPKRYSIYSKIMPRPTGIFSSEMKGNVGQEYLSPRKTYTKRLPVFTALKHRKLRDCHVKRECSVMIDQHYEGMLMKPNS